MTQLSDDAQTAHGDPYCAQAGRAPVEQTRLANEKEAARYPFWGAATHYE